MSDINKPIAFIELLQTCRQIEVPLIQRDYAQGREGQKDVRDEFLKALHGALSLPPDDPKLPLNLDFIYGSMEGQDNKSFIPLDGQQRLTTLFLLHWYLAWLDDLLPSFHSTLKDGKHARFTYRVRPSSREFFDAIVSYQPAPGENVTSMRKLIQDQPWFFLHWRLDPTIQSALNMLEAIHERFKDTTGLYCRLVNLGQPVITFQLLRLEHFGLTDDLYIKMNARGKPLTAFETFKARFEELLKSLHPTEKRQIGGADLSIAEFFERRIDTQWTDLFWRYKDPSSNTFDDSLMNLFWVLIRASLNPADPKFTDDTASLRSRYLTATYQNFHDRGWLTRAFAGNLITLLETWSQGGSVLAQQLPDTHYFNELSFFEHAIRSPADIEYTTIIMFAAFIFYLRQHEGAVQPAQLTEWMRVLYNLAHNTYIERPDEFGRSLAGLRKLLPCNGGILERLAEMDIEPLGFSQQQLREEALKAKLILSHAGWKSRLLKAEQHGYFRGQISFLLEFAGVLTASKQAQAQDWSEKFHTELQAAFDHYLSRAQLMFDGSGLTPIRAHLWKRALLSKGSYVIRYGRNFSFLTDAPTNSDSWKRFLRDETPQRAHLKSLWDRINPMLPVESQLDQIITDAKGLEPWRAAVVQHPAIIDYCGVQEFRWEEGADEIYLLSKQQMNGFHAELFSYALHQELESDSSLKSLEPLKLQPYQAVTMTEVEPHVSLSFSSSKRNVRFSIVSRKNRFQIEVSKSVLASWPTLEAALKNDCEFTEMSEIVVHSTSREKIHAVLRQIAGCLAGLPPRIS